VLEQYVEVARDEPARWTREAHGQAGRSGVSAVAVEAFMNNVGYYRTDLGGRRSLNTG